MPGARMTVLESVPLVSFLAFSKMSEIWEKKVSQEFFERNRVGEFRWLNLWFSWLLSNQPQACDWVHHRLILVGKVPTAYISNIRPICIRTPPSMHTFHVPNFSALSDVPQGDRTMIFQCGSDRSLPRSRYHRSNLSFSPSTSAINVLHVHFW